MSADALLVQRATAADVRRASGIAERLRHVDADDLVAEYHQMVKTAPRRGDDGHTYFVQRTGKPTSRVESNRREELLAMGLVNDGAEITTHGESMKLLTYAFPLFTTGGPQGIRAVDAVGFAADTGRLWIVELKVAAQRGYGETPLRALYEALVYAAVVEANRHHVEQELAEQGHQSRHSRPGLLVAAPDAYWTRWTPNERIGEWWTPFRSLTAQLAEKLETPVTTVSLGSVVHTMDADGYPRLAGDLVCRPADH